MSEANSIKSRCRAPGFGVLILLLAFLLASGCATRPEVKTARVGARVVVDDLGNRVRLPSGVTRAVSLAPNITEIVFAVGAGDDLVGVTTYCNYPEAAKSLPKIGDTLKPNIESIIALRPQVVFVSTASQLEGFVGVLNRQGISVFVTSPDSLEGVYRSIRKIGDALGKKRDAAALVDRLKGRVSKVRESVRGTKPVEVFVQIDRSLYTIGKDSYLTALVATAGGSSVTRNVGTAYPKISRELARALDPEVIVLSVSPDNDRPSDVFDHSRAVINKRIVRINADVLSRPGPRIADALELLAMGFHGAGGR